MELSSPGTLLFWWEREGMLRRRLFDSFLYLYFRDMFKFSAGNAFGKLYFSGILPISFQFSSLFALNQE